MLCTLPGVGTHGFSAVSTGRPTHQARTEGHPQPAMEFKHRLTCCVFQVRPLACGRSGGAFPQNLRVHWAPSELQQMHLLFISYEYSCCSFSGNGAYAVAQVRALRELGQQVAVLAAHPASHIPDTPAPDASDTWVRMAFRGSPVQSVQFS